MVKRIWTRRHGSREINVGGVTAGAGARAGAQAGAGTVAQAGTGTGAGTGAGTESKSGKFERILELLDLEEIKH